MAEPLYTERDGVRQRERRQENISKRNPANLERREGNLLLKKNKNKSIIQGVTG